MHVCTKTLREPIANLILELSQLLGATKGMASQRMPPVLGQEAVFASHLPVIKHMANTFLYKQVSCKLIYSCARLCVFVQKTTKTNLGETFSMSACTHLIGGKTVTAF